MHCLAGPGANQMVNAILSFPLRRRSALKLLCCTAGGWDAQRRRNAPTQLLLMTEDEGKVSVLALPL